MRKRTQNIIPEINDFIFIVRDREIEKDEKTLIEKEYFKGYIGILNHTMINETDSYMTIYDKQLNKYLNDNLTNVITPNLKYIGENGNICFIKIEFYLNGEIKNYYLPNGFSEIDFAFIEDITKLMIPKISSNLYEKNISEKLNELSSKKTAAFKKRPFNKKYKKYSIPSTKNSKNKVYNNNRRFEESDYTTINNTDDIDIDVEEYLVEPLSKSIN